MLTKTQSVIIGAAFKNPDYTRHAGGMEEYFTSDSARRIYGSITRRAVNGEACTLTAIMSELGAEDSALLSEIVARQSELRCTPEEFRDLCERQKQDKLQKSTDDIKGMSEGQLKDYIAQLSDKKMGGS